MRRTATLLVLVGLLAGTAAMPARAKRPKVAQKRTFYIVAGAERYECTLSSNAGLADPGQTCGNDAHSPLLGGEPTWIPSLATPSLALDVARPIKGRVKVNSRYAWGNEVPAGAGQAQLRVTVVGVVAGKEVTVGSFTSDPYTVWPLQTGYWVEFEIEPDAALAGAELRELAVGLEVLGPNAFHNRFRADGLSAVTVPLAR